MINALRTRGVDLGIYINADDISRALSDKGPADQYDRDRKAQMRSRQQRYAALETGQSLSYETVMSHDSHIDFMREARNRGYEVHLYFVGVSDPQINIDRIAQRVAQGGHDVPKDKTLKR